MTKNILFILSRYPAVGGGIEKVTTYLSNVLQKEGYRVSILSFSRENTEENKYLLPDKGIAVYNTPHGMDDVQNEKNIFYVNKVICDNKIDTVIFQDSYSRACDILYHLKKVHKLIVVEHNVPTALIDDKVAEFKETRISDRQSLIRKIMFPVIYFKNVMQVRNHHRVMYAISDQYVVLSKSYINTVKRLACTKDSQHKILAINNPVTIDIPNHIDLNNKAKEVLFVGRLVSQKGVDYLLNIWKKFIIREGNWILRIIGDGPLRSKIEKRILDEHIKNIILEGNQKNVGKYYQRSSIVCVTSRYEGWSLVLVEAMTYGNVTLAFNSYNAVYDIIRNGENGFIINAFDENSYVDKLLVLTRDNNLRIQMAVNAMKSVNRFTMDSIVKQWEEII
jgi:glycosyltransferase involved in cell wall biosynthesis